MIITRLKGGLGNQLFQYAAGLVLAKKFDEELKLDVSGFEHPSHMNSDTPRTYRLKAFAISGGVASKEEAMNARNPYGILSRLWRFFNQRILKRNVYFDYHPDYFKKRHNYVEGYFQSEKNFLDIEKEIRNEFTLKKEFETEFFVIQKEEIVSKNCVSVHIRRGDYVKDQKTQNFHGNCSKDYYERGMEYIQSNVADPTFCFFSDDIEWTKKEFGEHPKHLFVSNPRLEDYEELVLMSFCKHHIIANSSFSWWGAWLNTNPHKIVVTPKKWLQVDPDPQPNILPDSWVRM